MQNIKVNFKRSIVPFLRTKITKMKTMNNPLTSVSLDFIDRIVEKHQQLYKTSEKYLNSLENFLKF